MEITRTLTRRGRLTVLEMRASFDPRELEVIERYGMWNYRIQTRDGPFAGRDAISLNLKTAFRTQFGKVKNRWSAALIRTTGFVITDVILFAISALWAVVKSLVKIVVGRRRRLGRVVDGITIRSTRIERIKEAEFFIFISLAAVAKAIAYAQAVGSEKTYRGDTLFSEIEGLDFAGAGNHDEDEFDNVRMLSAQLSRAG